MVKTMMPHRTFSPDEVDLQLATVSCDVRGASSDGMKVEPRQQYSSSTPAPASAHRLPPYRADSLEYAANTFRALDKNTNNTTECHPADEFLGWAKAHPMAVQMAKQPSIGITWDSGVGIGGNGDGNVFDPISTSGNVSVMRRGLAGEGGVSLGTTKHPSSFLQSGGGATGGGILQGSGAMMRNMLQSLGNDTLEEPRNSLTLDEIKDDLTDAELYLRYYGGHHHQHDAAVNISAGDEKMQLQQLKQQAQMVLDTKGLEVEAWERWQAERRNKNRMMEVIEARQRHH